MDVAIEIESLIRCCIGYIFIWKTFRGSARARPGVPIATKQQPMNALKENVTKRHQVLCDVMDHRSPSHLCRAKEEGRKSQMVDFAFLVSFDAEFEASFGPKRKLRFSFKILSYFKFLF